MSRGSRSRSRLRAPLLLAVVALLAGPTARADLYSFVAPNGSVHFSNVPTDERYRPIVLRPLAQPSGSAFRDESGYDRMIEAAARRHDVPAALVKAVIRVESNFNAGAVSRTGARGLMQLMPDTARALGVVNAFHPVENLNGGVLYLRAMLKRYGDLSRALAAYNAGPTAVDRYGGIPPYGETRDYVDKVLAYYRDYHGDFRQ